MYLSENVCEKYDENPAQRKSSDLDKYKSSVFWLECRKMKVKDSSPSEIMASLFEQDFRYKLICVFVYMKILVMSTFNLNFDFFFKNSSW